MKRKRILIHRNSEKKKLVSEVTFLCKKLNRPICSADLRDHFKTHPNRRPNLLQRYGQLLIKATRPLPDPIPKIYAIGIYRNKTYYAPDLKPYWNEAFENYILRQQMLLHLRSRFLDHAIYLIRSSHQGLTRNAIAGWICELKALLKKCKNKNFSEPHEIIAHLKEAKPYASKEYKLRNPKLINRAQASEFLMREFRRRNPEIERNPSLNRYLSKLRWPQCTLFSKSSAPLYCIKQMKAFVSARWPMKNEDSLESQALWIILRYGDCN